MRISKSNILAVFALALVMAAPASASSVTLLDVQPPASSNTPYALTFTADPTMRIVFAGSANNPNGDFSVFHISLTASGGSNVLGQTWNLTRALSGSVANQWDGGHGTGTNDLAWAAQAAGSFDLFYQLVNLTAGQQYTLAFGLYNNVYNSTPAWITVSAEEVANTPEPAAFLLAGLGLLGLVARKHLGGQKA